MSDIAIRVHGLGKQYQLGPRERYKTLRDTVTDMVSAPFRAIANVRWSAASGQPSTDLLWALKDVSLEINHGEAVGIIGRNGAGKSTLLKILSRITEPTEGYAEIYGRVGSLLEVGTGFHSELTGRENIYLNGAILGMKKVEIARKFDEIVAFAEIEKFLDTPVKHYSSGMFVRLAFAVAAHLEPEILLVDEVLAVGDIAFQKKCLGKMQDVAGEGRTVLFVSHNLSSLANLCPRAILLVQGTKWCDGASRNVINEYLGMGKQEQGQVIWRDPSRAPGNDHIRLHAVRIVTDGQVTSEVDIQRDVHVEVEFWNFMPGAKISTSIHLLDRMGTAVLATWNVRSANLVTDAWYDRPHPSGLYRAVCILPGNFLNEGMYSINAIVLTDVTKVEVFAREVVSFTVHDTGAMRKEFGGIWIGVVRPRLAWLTEYIQPLDSALSQERI
jgi:lipopolysaccharide transport system ATP-binding protein